jgi:xanthine dehydrogenase accessory factor
MVENLGLFPGPGDTDWPLYGLVDDIRPALAALFAEGQDAALCTLIDVDGPSPRPVGAQMLVAADGAAAGYVSGGCVEGSLALMAKETLASGKPRLVVFGKGSPFMDVKLVCGSRIDVLIEPARHADESLHEVLAGNAARHPVLRELDLDTGEAMATPLSPARAPGPAAGLNEGSAWRLYAPTLRLAVIGADPVALALARLADQAGLAATLIRPDGPSQGPVGFGQAYQASAPALALAGLGLDPWTAVVTTTHDLDLDHQTLSAALPSPAFYVGALGSRRRLADRLGRLTNAGLDWSAVKRLRAPVGLDIGAAAPGEIAISILADVIAAHRGREAQA